MQYYENATAQVVAPNAMGHAKRALKWIHVLVLLGGFS